MSETQDRDSRTEEATEKRLTDARERGEVPVSREVQVFMSFLAITTCLYFWVGPALLQITRVLRSLLSSVGTKRISDTGLGSDFFWNLLGPLSAALLPMLVLLAAGGIIASAAQNPIVMITDRVVPKWSRISPKEGFGRLFGLRGLVEFVKALAKLLGVGCLTYWIIKAEMGHVLETVMRPSWLLLEGLRSLILKLLSGLTIGALVIMMADVAWSRFSWGKNLRMTKQEVKEEHRQAEGDPMVKRRFRVLARQRSARRMMAQVPKASMIIANPTHYAIALRYDQTQDAAPVVLAKGLDAMALRIRAVAEDNGVPVIENKPLARALYDKVEIDTMIPAEFFRAVAEMIHFLNMRNLARR